MLWQGVTGSDVTPLKIVLVLVLSFREIPGRENENENENDGGRVGITSCCAMLWHGRLDWSCSETLILP
jgi:hypothetical protein